MNYFNYWTKRTIKDALKSMKLVVGIGLIFVLATTLNLWVAGFFFAYLLLDTLATKN